MTYEEFIKRYRFDINDPQAEIGSGGFGKVYKAYDSLHHKWVAVKVVPVDQNRDHISLRAEIEKAQSLPDHSNIVRYEACYRFKLPGGSYDYAVMQYYEEGNLSQLLERGGISPEQRDKLAREVLDGISFLHKHRILHRDLKSSNVLIARYGEEYIPLIADFGLSKQLEEDTSQIENSIIGGSALFTAPEQLMGEQLRYNADLWSYGVIIYQIFTKQFPYYPDNTNSGASGIKVYKKIMENPVPPLLNHIPEPWKQICQQCLIVDPAVRAAGAGDLKKILESTAYQHEETTVELKPRQEPSPPPIPEQKAKADAEPEKKGRGQRLTWGIAIGVFLVVLLIMVVMPPFSGGSSEEAPALEPATGLSGKWGYKNSKGQWVIKPRFKKALSFSSDGFATVELDTLGQSFSYTINTKGVCVSGCPQLSDPIEAESNGMDEVATRKITQLLAELSSVDNLNERDQIIQRYDLPGVIGEEVQIILDDELLNQDLTGFLTYLALQNKAYRLIDFIPVQKGKPGLLELKTK